jgi:hypothetical protein
VVHGLFFSESENGTAASHICSRMFLERRIGFPARSWRHQGKQIHIAEEYKIPSLCT